VSEKIKELAYEELKKKKNLDDLFECLSILILAYRDEGLLLQDEVD
jgi:hypothetical protein